MTRKYPPKVVRSFDDSGTPIQRRVRHKINPSLALRAIPLLVDNSHVTNPYIQYMRLRAKTARASRLEEEEQDYEEKEARHVRSQYFFKQALESNYRNTVQFE
jgi:hypothetical protein